MSAAAGAIIGGTIGTVGHVANMVGGYNQQLKQLRAMKMAAIAKYSGQEEALNIMQSASDELAEAVVQDILRVGAEEDRTLQGEIKQAESSMIAQQEGITSGVSKARQAMAFKVKGTKLLSQSKSQTASMITQTIDKKDSTTNNINNQKLAAYDEMKAILSMEVPKLDPFTSTMSILTAGMGGAASGASIYNAVS